MNWLNQLATPRLVFLIFASLITVILGPIALALLLFGNTSAAWPFWSIVIFAIGTLGVYLSALRQSASGLAICLFSLSLFAVLSHRSGKFGYEFWPARLLVADSADTQRSIWLLTGLWATSVLAAIIIGCDFRRLLSLIRARGAAFSIKACATVVLLWAITWVHAELTIRNIAYAMAQHSETATFGVIKKVYSGRDIILTIRDIEGRSHTVMLDDFYRREVQIYRKDNVGRQAAMTLPWNQSYCPGDVLITQGRRSFMGLAIDHIAKVLLTDAGACARDRQH